MEVWAYEVCFCKFETGFQVRTLHETKESAENFAATKEEKQHRKICDDWRISEWEVRK